MKLEKVKLEDVIPNIDYLIQTGSFWDVAEYWPDMDEGEQWFNGDVFLDAKEIYGLP